MVKIRLTRKGTTKKPFYRIVVADSQFPRDGRFIEIVGTYDPRNEKTGITVHGDRIRYWLNNGAQPTDTVRSILKASGISPKSEPKKSEASVVA